MTRRIEIVATPEFERELALFMERRAIGEPTEAIRLAIHEVAGEAPATAEKTWDGLLGWANRFPDRPREEWVEREDLWS